jgi:hypothetical protein
MPTNSDQAFTESKVRVVHQPVVETRSIGYLSEALPYRIAAIRDQINAQHTMLGQATGDAVRLAKPENAHLITEGYGPSYLAAVAANAALMASTLRNSAKELIYAAFLAGYNTSSLAATACQIEELADQVNDAYQRFTALERGPKPG